MYTEIAWIFKYLRLSQSGFHFFVSEQQLEIFFHPSANCQCDHHHCELLAIHYGLKKATSSDTMSAAALEHGDGQLLQ